MRWQGFRELGLLDAAALPYVCKPLAAGMVPGAGASLYPPEDAGNRREVTG